jgi:uncharacterized protein (TIGR03382 family)
MKYILLSALLILPMASAQNSTVTFPETLVTLTFSPMASAQNSTVTFGSVPDLIIPDDNPIGVADFLDVATLITSIESIELTLEISGGFNGDYYSYLQHESGFAVLLNRPGRSSLSDTDVSSLGYIDSGIAVSITEAASDGDIHNYRNVSNPDGGQLTGTFQPDGRHVDPSLSIDSTPRTATLSSFTGLNPNGTWGLFVNDNSAVGIGTLDSWGLTINGTIPEPSTLSLALLATATLLRRRR